MRPAKSVPRGGGADVGDSVALLQFLENKPTVLPSLAAPVRAK